MENGGLRIHSEQVIYDSKMPLISVITVVYNDITNIEDTIKSVLRQSYNNIEYIIIDGASDDGTIELIKKYDKLIDYWQSEPDRGIYDAMNKGIDLSNGEWVCFMNAGDTFFNEDVITNVFFKSKCKGDVIFGNVNQIFEFGSRIVKGADLMLNSKHMTFNHQSCFTKLDKLKHYHYDIHYRICADFDFYRKLKFNNSLFEYVDIIISNYDNIKGVSSVNPLKMYKETLEIRKIKIKWVYIFLYTIKIKTKALLKIIVPKKILTKYRRGKYLI